MAFRIAALTILAVFYGCYFWKMLDQREKGIQTDQMGKGKAGFEKGIECALKAASILVVMAEICSIALGTSCLPLWARCVGVGLGAAGSAVFIAAVMTMRDSWRAGISKTNKTRLVTGGIFQYSRNPAFLGFDLVYFGILLMFFNWVLLILSVFGAVMFHLQIVHVEERFLLEAFGDEYRDYQKAVRRYVGRSRA